MNGELLFNSKIIDICLKLVRHKYDFIEPRELLKHAAISLHDAADPEIWLAPRQIEDFFAILHKTTGKTDIAREAGRFAAAPEAARLIRQYTLGFTSPTSSFAHFDRFLADFDRSCAYEHRRIGPGKVEITAIPKPGARQPAGQCLFRQGLLEAVVTLFNLDTPCISHPECVHHQQAYCRYRIHWKPSLDQAMPTLRKISALATLAVPAVTSIFNPALALQVALPATAALFAGLSLFTDHLQKSRLAKNLYDLRNISDDMARQIERSRNHTMLGNEITHLIGSRTTIEDILQSVSQTFEKRLEFERGIILLPNEEQTRLDFRAGFGLPAEQQNTLENTLFPLGNALDRDIFSLAFRQKRAFIVNDIDHPQEDASALNLNGLRKTGCRSAICCPILCDGKAFGILAAGQAHCQRPLKQSDQHLLSGLANVIGVSIRNAQLLTSRKHQFNSTLQVLAATIDARDPLTAGHSEKVTEYSMGICKELGLSEDECETIRVAALLHDYGKIAVPDAILKKSGQLTMEEYEIVKTHAQQTQDILKQINFEGIYRQVPQIAGAHHEKLDGSGYPKGLRADDIPLGAKIIAVADFFEAITAQRHYRAPMPLDVAYKVLLQKAYVHFDGQIVKAFIHFLKRAYPDDYAHMVNHLSTSQRKIMRVPCRMPVMIENAGHTLLGTIADISEGGIFVASTASVTEGAEVSLSFSLPNRPGKTFEANGRVAWINPKTSPRKLSSPSGFGIEFLHLHRKTLDAVDTFIRSLPKQAHA